MELVGEYVGPDGEPRPLRVSCETSGDADPLQSLLSGVAQMKELVAEFFGSLGQREAPGRVGATPDDALDGDDEDDAEDENNIVKRSNSDGPSAKRSKPPS
ncbi:EKC/KEOPS complex subunit GON7 [Perognathus longimembris pacificus]|uniref:EKC/KEOPS complex subunit GON7 n=1 Tax=Perognathus longimembris pacificus TaxID=214514 RepID=UPI002019E809|nr:EKC/KEOPS complex subunit GON7 [Perognathus longimembris pacificus]